MKGTLFITCQLALCLCTSCASALPRPAEDTPTASSKAQCDGPGPLANYKPHTPAEFMQLMSDSKVTYVYDMSESGQEVMTTLGSAVMTAATLDPEMIRVEQANGKVTVGTYKANWEATALIKQGIDAFGRKEYERAVEIYARAARVDPGYFFSWVNLGSTLITIKQYDKGVTTLKHALKLNPLSYQANWFLADAYMFMGQKELALKAATKAFMLNRENPRLRMFLKPVLESNGLKLRRNRVSFPFLVRRESADKCSIIIRSKEDARWLGMANCLAVWKMEPKFIAMDRAAANCGRLNLKKYRQCLVHQAIRFQGAAQKGETLSDDEKRFIQMVKNDMEAIIIWELIVKASPQVILLVPDNVREHILRYIHEHVYERTRNPDRASRPGMTA